MRQYALGISAGAVAAALLLLNLVIVPPNGGLWLRTFFNSLHVPLFGIIAICALLVTPRRWGRRKRLLSVAGIVLLLSVLSEVAQIPGPRDASIEDLIADWLGASGFLAIASVFSRSILVPKGRGRYLVLIGIVLIAWPLLPLAKVSAAYVERSGALPSLVRFDSRLGRMFFYAQNADLHIDTQSSLPAVEVTLEDGSWPGIVFHDIWPAWEAYTALTISIENPDSEPFPINVRIHDRTHRLGQQAYSDRFNTELNLLPGPQTVRIDLADVRMAPAGRQMNMADIDGLVLFATRKEAGRRFVLHDIRLQKPD